jgi:broad specificity phosphatase PhoE
MSSFLSRFLITSENKFLLPKRIILVRHGESLGNEDESAYSKIPDWKIGLTNRGEQQSKQAGQDLAELCRGERLFTYVSPYDRTMQTWQFMKEELQAPKSGEPLVTLIGTRQEPRIAEQQFGNFQDPGKVQMAKEERRNFGRFFFRFPNGESGLDVYNRATSFLSTLGRDISTLRDMDIPMEDCNILVVTHGLTLRLFLMRYFQLTVEEFEQSHNPNNSKLLILDRCMSEDHSGRQFFRLEEASRDLLNLKGDVSNEKPVFLRDRYDFQ